MSLGDHARWDELVAYFKGELSVDEEARLEEHLMGCDSCTAECEKLTHIVESLRATIPPIVTDCDVERLRSAGLRVVSNDFVSGDCKEAYFQQDTELLLHRLKVDLEGVDAVSVEIKTLDGQTLASFRDVPFDHADRAIGIACRPHFATISPDPDLVFVLRDRAQRVLGEYIVLHRFA